MARTEFDTHTLDLTRPEFQVKKLNVAGTVKAEQIAIDFSALLTLIEDYGVTGRELALCKTYMENACFNAKRGIALLAENQDQEKL
jgi:hypothetical protein